jgi:hypothetical protein
MNFRTTCLSVLLGCAAVGAWAQTSAADPTNTPRVDARQQHQQARINQGVASGALTGREAHRLQREQRAIRHAETHAKADGVVTAGERARLHRMQNQASRDIHHQKHDRQRRAASAP